MRNEGSVSEIATSLPATFGNAFNKTDNAFSLHDVSNFENILQQSGAQIHSNPFNDSVSAFSSPAPKKDADYHNDNNNNNSNNNISAIFNSYSGLSTNKPEFINSSGTIKQDHNSAMNNPFSATEKSNNNNNNTWHELNALDLNQLRFELSNDEKQSSIFGNAANPEAMAGKVEMKKEIPVDLFKDVAKAAFSEFNTTRHHKNHEFFNKISGFDCVRT